MNGFTTYKRGFLVRAHAACLCHILHAIYKNETIGFDIRQGLWNS